MNCMFIGHKDTFERVKPFLKNAILKLIQEEQVNMFYVGNNGNFDFFVQKTLREIANIMPSIEYVIVLSRIEERAISNDQDATIFPEGLESVPPKFAISKRNEWIMKRSQFMIAYVEHKFSNSYKWLEKAKKKGITVIDLAETANKKCFVAKLKHP